MSRLLRPAGRLAASSIRTARPHSIPLQHSSSHISRRAVISSATQPQHRYASSTASKHLLHTDLHSLHVERGGTMVPFGGYSMPVQYSDQSIQASHHWTRTNASLFDVGHMVQHKFSGSGAQTLLEKITPSALSTLGTNRSTLSCLLHPTGGIVDDTVITRLGPETFYMVTNAGCRTKDTEFLESEISSLPSDVSSNLHWERLDQHGLLALQGPLAVEILRSCLSRAVGSHLDLKSLYFGQCASSSLHFPSSGHMTQSVLISRGGYTGEDGFELSIPPESTVAVAKGLLESAGHEKLRLAGLGARDSLRLEAGMCLYGHDLNDETTPAEAGLGWVVAKERREQGGFNGAERVLKELKPKKEGGGVGRKRVGLVVDGAPAREGAKIVDVESQQEVGVVTSGCPSPTMGVNIAMGYVKTGYTKAGTKVGAVVRGKVREAEVVKMPFVPSKFYREAVSPA